jgi:hypothetical protein
MSDIHDLLLYDPPRIRVEGFIERMEGRRNRHLLVTLVRDGNKLEVRKIARHFFELFKTFTGRDDGFCIAVREDKPQPISTRSRVYGYHDRAYGCCRQETVCELGVVPHENRKHVSVPDAFIEQQSGEFVGLLIQVLVREHILAMLTSLEDEYFSIGHLFGPDLHEVRRYGLIEVRF